MNDVIIYFSYVHEGESIDVLHLCDSLEVFSEKGHFMAIFPFF